jgi:hypothetical protein
MTTQKTEWIIWNGCDGYDMAECGDSRNREYHAVPVVAVTDVPLDADGEPDFYGLFIADGRVFLHA